MSKKDDTFEMLDDAPEKSKKSILLFVILILLTMGGISIYLQKQDNNEPSSVATVSTPVQNEPPASTQSPTVQPSVITAVVNFDQASAILTPDQKEKLTVFYNSVKDKTGIVQIDGYTDNMGLAAEGVVLSKQRSEAVAAYLQTLGSGKNLKFNIAYFGENNPVGDNSTEQGRRQNRRVELKFTPAP